MKRRTKQRCEVQADLRLHRWATDLRNLDPSDQDTRRLKIEVDEMRRFMPNQQDQLLVAIRTATAAAMAATEVWYQPRERTDPGIGEAIEKV